MKITIERRDQDVRAFCHLRADLAAAVGVKGSMTSEGPWIEGIGRTADEALDALYRAIGRAYVHVHVLSLTEET